MGRIPLLIAETILVITTITRTWDTWREGTKLTYTNLVLRDGAVYFMYVVLRYAPLLMNFALTIPFP